MSSQRSVLFGEEERPENPGGVLSIFEDLEESPRGLALALRLPQGRRLERDKTLTLVEIRHLGARLHRVELELRSQAATQQQSLASITAQLSELKLQLSGWHAAQPPKRAFL